MQKDIRETAVYKEAEALHRTLRQPGTGQISEAAQVHASPDGRNAVFVGTLMEKLEGAPTRICLASLETGDARVLTFGPNSDRSPMFSPNGRHVAFVSDRHKPGDFQLHLLDPISGAVRPTPRVDGWVEYLQWSPDGTRILLGVAGHGADLAGGAAPVSGSKNSSDLPSWLPTIVVGNEEDRWRGIWIYDLDKNCVRRVSAVDCNVWEAAWCGVQRIAAVTSPGPGEGLWYSARLSILEIEGGNVWEAYAPRDQLGCPAASPSGRHLAIVEAVCSDRGLVAGDLRVMDTASREVRTVDTQGVDITYTEWRSDRHLLLAGHRGFETVVGLYDATAEIFTEVWSSHEITTGGRYVAVSGLNATGDCVLAAEGFVRAPEIAVIRQGKYRAVKSFDLGYAEEAKVIETVDCVSWTAPDGLEIQGWLLRPAGRAPHPLVMYVHGGPVWQWRPMWLGGGRRPGILMMLKRGYALFFPNPRGSTGRGQSFVRRVIGDMGGADSHDCLSGLDHLVRQGIADPARLGVMGASYGGFMTSWLVTQDLRFAAAVSLSPATNHVTSHLLSNIPHFVALFVADSYRNIGGEYFRRSPVLHAHKAKTPTFNICGALDRCTPPEEAVQFHNALLENGVESALATYPQEGHGVRNLPAAIDCMARIVGWFEDHMPAQRAGSTATSQR